MWLSCCGVLEIVVAGGDWTQAERGELCGLHEGSDAADQRRQSQCRRPTILLDLLSLYFVSFFQKLSQNSSFCLNCLLCWSYSVLDRVTGKRTYKGLTEAGFYGPDALPVTNRVKALYLQHDRLNIVVLKSACWLECQVTFLMNFAVICGVFFENYGMMCQMFSVSLLSLERGGIYFMLAASLWRYVHRFTHTHRGVHRDLDSDSGVWWWQEALEVKTKIEQELSEKVCVLFQHGVLCLSVCPSICLSVCPSVCPFVRPSVCPLVVDTCLSCEDIARQSCAMVPRWRFFGSCISSEPRVAHFRPAF